MISLTLKTSEVKLSIEDGFSMVSVILYWIAVSLTFPWLVTRSLGEEVRVSQIVWRKGWIWL